MAGLLTELGVAGKLAYRRLTGHGPEPLAEPDLGEFRERWQKVLDSMPEGLVRDYYWVEFAASEVPWRASGIQLASGDEVSPRTHDPAAVPKPLP